MAILFAPQPKRKENLLVVSFLMLAVSLVAVSFVIFPPAFVYFWVKPQTVEPVLKPNLTIDFNVVDSDQFKNLEIFPGARVEFNYIGYDKDEKKIVGSIVATDRNAARMMLEKMGLRISSIEEKDIGRLQPFVPYY